MTDQFVDTNKIVPAHELVQKWANETDYDERHWLYEIHIANRAAAWGADAELEACVKWLGEAPVVYNDNGDLHPGLYLRDARRPKPPSLKELALEALASADGADHPVVATVLTADQHALIRRALEQLND